MNHFGHILVGLAAGFAIYYAASAAGLGLNLAVVNLVAVSALGALLPDIDLKQSKISKVAQLVFIAGGTILLEPFASKFFSFPILTSWVVALAASAVLLFLILFPLRLRHRGITHSLEAAVVFGIAIALLAGLGAGIIGLAGYASHIVVDKL